MKRKNVYEATNLKNLAPLWVIDKTNRQNRNDTKSINLLTITNWHFRKNTHCLHHQKYMDYFQCLGTCWSGYKTYVLRLQ